VQPRPQRKTGATSRPVSTSVVVSGSRRRAAIPPSTDQCRVDPGQQNAVFRPAVQSYSVPTGMRIPYFQINAFTSKPFAGNPAGVCPLEQWLPDPLLQRIAAENNLSETAFLMRREGFYDLRWMTPTTEVDLCGHATLACAFVLFFEMRLPLTKVVFRTLSGQLSATRLQNVIELDFPVRPPQKCAAPDALLKGLGRAPNEVLKSRDYFVVFQSADEVQALEPDMRLFAELDSLGVIVTAPSRDVDFVSRFFAPKVGVPEDPVTGSAHSSLIPFWSERLGKAEMTARQISKRGGELFCRMLDERVGIGGEAVTYCRGELEVP
jgi:predicted PhzF superfamily epimerase YddE/YHI9